MITALLAAGSIVVCAELLLRYHATRRSLMTFDVENFPYYRRPRNSKGKEAYFVEREGWQNTAVMQTYSEGIRSDIRREKRPLILTIGCSFAEGAFYPDNETFAGHLERFLGNKYAVINAGIGGYGPFQKAAMLSSLAKYKPKAAIVQLLDFKRIPLNEEKVIAGKKELLFYQRLKTWSHLLYYVSKLKPRRFAGVRSPFVVRDKTREQLWELNKAYLDDMRATCAQHHISLTMFVWPNINPTVLHNWFLMDKVKEYCAEHNINTFDARAMTGHYDPNELVLEHDAHPNALANRLMAKAAWKCLEENGMV